MELVNEPQLQQANEGIHNATIKAIEDIGKIETVYGVKDMLEITLDINDMKAEDGSGFVELRQRYTKSFDKRASLVKFLKGIGIVLNPGEKLDTDSLIGRTIQIVSFNREDKITGQTYANIHAVIPSRKPKVNLGTA